jgi:hypothetical protein
MSTNLVASAAKLLTPELISRIATALGVTPSAIEKAFAAGVPGLLAAITSLIGKPGGTARLSEAISQQPLGQLADMTRAGPAAQKEMVDGGFSALSSLLGGNTVSSLAGALGRYSGLGDSAAKSVMGLIGPAVLGVLGQQQRAEGLDATGLAQLLESQKSNISRALPSGFANQLSATGIGDWARGATVRDTRREDTSHTSWLMPALGVLALGALAWYLFGRPHDSQTVATAPPANMESQMGAAARDFIITAAEEKNWIGRPVFSHDNQKVGEIVEIRRGPDNKVTDIYFDAGQDLGVGAKRYHVSTGEIEQMRPDGVVVTLKETDVKALPDSTNATQQ